MIIIGADYHPGFQQIAFVDIETGDCGEQRLEHCERAAKIDLRVGDYMSALSKIRSVVDSDPADAQSLALLGYSYALAGRKKQALAALDELGRLGRQRYVNPGSIAMIWVRFGG